MSELISDCAQIPSELRIFNPRVQSCRLRDLNSRPTVYKFSRAFLLISKSLIYLTLLAGHPLHLSRLSSEKQGSLPQNSRTKRLWWRGLREPLVVGIRLALSPIPLKVPTLIRRILRPNEKLAAETRMSCRRSPPIQTSRASQGWHPPFLSSPWLQSLTRGFASIGREDAVQRGADVSVPEQYCDARVGRRSLGNCRSRAGSLACIDFDRHTVVRIGLRLGGRSHADNEVFAFKEFVGVCVPCLAT
jgi:hypothetical protein